MRRGVIKSGRLRASVAACAALAIALPAVAAAAHAPLALTGKLTRVRGVTVLLSGTVNPEGSPTTYYFQFGPTLAYGSRTAFASAGSGTAAIKVGLPASPFGIGYHYRIVATNASGTTFGRDRVFAPKTTKLKFELPRSETLQIGTSVVITGRMTGLGAANHRIALLESPWPYKEAFERVGTPTVTSPTGRFSFRVGAIRVSTQYKVETLDAFPHFSKTDAIHIAAKVTLKLRTSSQSGLVRLYGTVTPVEVGARVDFQLEREVRPGLREKTEERTSRFATVAFTTVKHATRKFSRFSGIVKIKRGGRYHAVVVIRSGPLVSGVSRTITVHGPAAKKH